MKNILRSDLVARQVVREVHLLRMLSQKSKGKHICELRDLELAQVGEELHIFLVMDYVGTTLDRFMLSNRHSYKEKHIIKLAYNILAALNFLHSANVMHRDLKPENILVNEQLDVFLIDFGLARSVPKTAHRAIP